MPGSSTLPLNASVRPALPAATAQSERPGDASPLPDPISPGPGSGRRRLPAVSPPEFPNCPPGGAPCSPPTGSAAVSGRPGPAARPPP